MIRIDAYFLYQVGTAVHPLTAASEKWTKGSTRGRLWTANHWLDTLLNKSIYKLQTCRGTGLKLLETIGNISKRYEAEGKEDSAKMSEEIGWWDSWRLESEANAF